jgi:hypothetical protein
VEQRKRLGRRLRLGQAITGVVATHISQSLGHGVSFSLTDHCFVVSAAATFFVSAAALAGAVFLGWSRWSLAGVFLAAAFLAGAFSSLEPQLSKPQVPGSLAWQLA